jgi:replicative DNA helicase
LSAIRLRRRNASSDIEKAIITGMIVSTDFLRALAPVYDKKYFKNDYTKTIAKWVMDYYDKYKECPSLHIKDIYKTEKDKLKEANSELVATFLDDLSRRYENETNFNVEYLLDRTFAYFKETALSVAGENILAYIGAGEIDKAELEVINYKNVTKILTNWVDPFDLKFVSNAVDLGDTDETENPDHLFKLIGPVGEHLGGFQRGWLVAFLAPMKKGKTFMLQEMALQAVGSRLNTVFISLEMNDRGISNRFYRMISGNGDRDCTIFPVFDCQWNQNGHCASHLRTNKITLYNNNELPKFDPTSNYKPCTACRGTKDYIVATWFETIQKNKLSLLKLKRDISGFKTMYGDSLRIKSYPAYSANLQQIKRDLDILENTEDFVPDVIIVDYADILAPESKQSEGRDRYDETWKMLKNMAATRHCLVITASQSNRKTLEKKDVKASDISEDIRKVAHVDAMFSLSQTPDEKKNGVMRLGVVAHRWKDFSETDHVIILQQLSTGQVILDSERGYLN